MYNDTFLFILICYGFVWFILCNILNSFYKIDYLMFDGSPAARRLYSGGELPEMCQTRSFPRRAVVTVFFSFTSIFQYEIIKLYFFLFNYFFNTYLGLYTFPHIINIISVLMMFVLRVSLCRLSLVHI